MPSIIEKKVTYQQLSAITTFYLVLPAIFFAYGWLKKPFDLMTISLILIYLFFTGKEIAFLFQEEKNNWKAKAVFIQSIIWVTPALFLIISWVALSGIGGIGFQNDDYRASNALFYDLILQDWPLSAIIDGQEVKIVYYFGYYLPAAAIGKIFGWTIANIFIFLWSLFGVLLAFSWFLLIAQITLRKSSWKILALTLLFSLAGGLDFLVVHSTRSFSLPWNAHIEVWAQHFQFSSNTTLLFWVPQHAIPIWLITGMVVGAIYKSIDIKYVSGSLAASILWSPFGIIGIFPFFLLLATIYLRSENRKQFLKPSELFFHISALWLGIIFGLFTLSNNFSFPITFVWKEFGNHGEFAALFLKFLLIEVGLLVYLILVYLTLGLRYSQREKPESKSERMINIFETQFKIRKRQLIIFLISVLFLTFLPFFKIGIYNDLVMRSSIPSLLIIWAFTGKLLLDPPEKYPKKFNFLLFLIHLVVFSGFLTSSTEILRSTQNYHIQPPRVERIMSTGNANRLDIVRQRAGNDTSFFYRHIGK